MSEQADASDGPASLEYEEDCYYAFVDTPSFDVVSEVDDECVFVIVEEEFDEPASLELGDALVEAELCDRRTGQSRNKWVRGLRVKFGDLSKPYLARITRNKNCTKFLQLVKRPRGTVAYRPRRLARTHLLGFGKYHSYK